MLFSFLLSKEWTFVCSSRYYYRGRSVISVRSYVLESRYFHSFSNVAEDHQTKNAKAIVKKGALLLKESELEIRV
jgi:hypothetical protein